MAGNPYTESGETFRIPDMLANRADVYNLGDVLTGKGDAFALSFIENALTSNAVLAPLATRSLDDVYKIIKIARGEPIPTTELSHGYSAVELADITAVLRHLFAAQESLLAVNAEYIRSAAQADAFRTEPPFKLQGSYRNMNKIAEKVVGAMTAAELDALIDDHYQGESQTLTTAAEQNLLKLAELRGKLAGARAQRWAEIKSEFVRQRRMGGGADDPVTRLVGTLSGLGSELQAIGKVLAAPKPVPPAPPAPVNDTEAWLGPRLDQLAAWLADTTKERQALKPAQPSEDHEWDTERLLEEMRRIERQLAPVADATVGHQAVDTLLANKMVQIIELLEQLNARRDPS